MRKNFTPWVFVFLVGFVFPPVAGADEVRLDLNDSRFRIEIPDVVLTNVPVSRVVITALNSEGEVDTTYKGRPLITGLRLAVDGRDTAIPPFDNGLLTLETDLAKSRKVYITGTEIVVDPESRQRGYLAVLRTQRWFSIVPPLLAVLLAVWLRNVVIALFVGVWSGAVILAHGDFFHGFIQTLETFLLEELVQSDHPEHPHMLIALFTMSMGAMIGVMSRCGGTHALVNSLSRYTGTRERGQLMTWGMGLVIFFDDYANTLLVGTTMRPITDRLKISREKLAFLVDSTAAPIAGLAIVSTWVGVEISYIGDTYARLGLSGEAYSTFLATIPYRFYPLHLVVFVWLIAYSGNDFGPMLKAEARALALDQLTRPQASLMESESQGMLDDISKRQLLRNALLPLVALFSLLVVGIWWTGSEALEAANAINQAAGISEIKASIWSILDKSSPNRVFFLSSFAASIVVVGSAVISRSLSLHDCMEAWLAGAKSMFIAILILVLAWGVATVCNEDHLNTAGFLVELAHGKLEAKWVPSLAFLLSGAVAFATGSSWSTMGLLLPLFISVTYYLLVGENDASPDHPLMLATIGAILAGSIFGDHCSPISDTTVLSSAAAGSDHLDHVTTQLPYALCVALVALLLGYLPAGFGYSPILLLPLGMIVLYVLVVFLGRSVEDYAETIKPVEVEEAPSEEDDQDTPDDKPLTTDAPPDREAG